jgi:flagellar biosynthesis protein FlhF
MHIRTFRAASLQDALEEIRRQMGSDASVLHTRQVREGWMGWLGRTTVEVTAGLRDRNEVTPHRIHPESDELSTSTHFRYPMELQDLRTMLTLAGVDEPLAERWISETYAFGVTVPGGVRAGDWHDCLRQTVARSIRLTGPIHCPIGERRVVALVGPTGVGKTTTIAKLAAGFRLEAKRRVGLITIDTFRIAAVQQLQAYAEIMDLPMEVVDDPKQMQAALDRLADVDLVLIDTAGRSPRSEARVAQLRTLLQAAAPNETHLVISATSSRETITNILDGFAPVQPTAMILTKLDEAVQTAGPLSALVGRQLPINYITNGQQVPDDIRRADAGTLTQPLLASLSASGVLNGYPAQYRGAA